MASFPNYSVYCEDMRKETVETFITDIMAERRAREMSLTWPGAVVVMERIDDGRQTKYLHGRKMR